MKTKTSKDRKKPILIIALLLLLSFIGLFIGAGISRSHLRKELITLQETIENRTFDNDLDSRLDALEKRNEKLNLIIGEDEEIEKWIASLRAL